MIIGSVGELWRYPVKSMAGERLDRCPVSLTGLLGDRGWARRDDLAGEYPWGAPSPTTPTVLGSLP